MKDAVISLFNEIDTEYEWFEPETVDGYAIAYQTDQILLLLARSTQDGQLYWTNGWTMTLKANDCLTPPINALGEALEEGRIVDAQLPIAA